MTLLDLTKELFTYLVRFREQAAGDRPPTLEKAEADLEAVFARMEDQAAANPLLAKGFEEVRYSLAALVDEVVLTSLWPHQAQWGQRGWERRLFGSQDGARRFFDFLDHLDSMPRDVLAVHYLCLALGFCGCYHPSDPELQQVKARILTKLPGLEPGNGPLTPQAISLTPLPAANKSSFPPASLAGPPQSGPAKVRRALRDLRYLLAGGLAVLAFVFTLGLGVKIFYDDQTDQELAEESTLESLLKPLLPSPSPTDTLQNSAAATSPPTTAVPDGSAATTMASAVGKSATTETTATSSTRTTKTTQAPASSVTTVTQAPASSPATSPAAPSPPAGPATTPGAEKSAPPASTGPTTYLLHAGLFVGPIQSGRLAERLSQAGFAAWVREEPRPDGSVRYRVYVGPFADPQRAETAREAIASQFKFSPYLVENPTP